MSPNEAQEYLINVFKSVPIAKSMGMSLEYDEHGQAAIRMPHNPGFHHGMKDTHGGVFATMLDSAGWFTAAAVCRKLVVTSDLHVRMLQPARRQDLVATARMVRTGSNLAVGEMRLSAADGDLIAVGTASFAVVGELGR